MTELNSSECAICRGTNADPELLRDEVWEDALWRLTVAREGEVAGFSYLEPKRHIPHIEDLDGPESLTFGTVLAQAARAIQNAAVAERVYVYIFGGGVPHLHVHLAPHRTGDALNDHMIRGQIVETQLPNGATAVASRDFPSLPEREHAVIRERIRQEMGSPKQPK